MIVLTSKKAIICFLGLSSIVLAGTIKDFNYRAVKLENHETFEKVSLPVERSVASEAVSRAAQLYLPSNIENAKKINMVWEITRIIDADEKVAFDKLANPEDAKKTIKVPMELIGNGKVRVNKDNEQIYRISLLSDFGTIALFKKMGNGHEIIEAKRVVNAKSNTSLLLVAEEEVELVLERALNQAKSNKVLEGADVSGQVSLGAKKITGLAVELKNPNGETQSIEIDTADLMDGGTFKTEVNGEDVSGVVLNNGKDGYRISFVTGPIAGSMLNFVTKDQMDKIQETQNDAQAENQAENQDTAPVQEEVRPVPAKAITPELEEAQLATERVVEERIEVANDVDSYGPVRVLSADEIRETAEQKGFGF